MRVHAKKTSSNAVTRDEPPAPAPVQLSEPRPPASPPALAQVLPPAPPLLTAPAPPLPAARAPSLPNAPAPPLPAAEGPAATPDVIQRALRQASCEANTKPLATPRKIVDGFMFNSELDILEIRLATLYDVVDWFVLVEGTHSLQGRPKKLHYNENKERFAMWSSKILYIKVDNSPKEVKQQQYAGDDYWGDYWTQEEHQRDAIGIYGIKELAERGALGHEDLVFVTDVDELPKKEVFEFLRWHQGYPDFIRFWMRWTYYGFMWQNMKSWQVAAGTTVATLRRNDWKTTQLRVNFFGEEDTRGSQVLEIGSPTGEIATSGWHCSWCFPTRWYIDKLQSFAHRELLKDHPELKSQGVVDALKAQGHWMKDQSPGIRVEEQDLEYAPQYVLDQKERFRYLLDASVPG